MFTLQDVYDQVNEVSLRAKLFGTNDSKLQELDDGFYLLGQTILEEHGPANGEKEDIQPNTILGEKSEKAFKDFIRLVS